MKNHSTEYRGKPCPQCKAEPTFYKGPPYVLYKHEADCSVGNMVNPRPIGRTAGTGASVRPILPYVCSKDPNHTADKAGPCPFCWAIAVALHGE